jgi:glutamine synthetase
MAPAFEGWKAINNSDMSMVPDPTTAWIDLHGSADLSMICTIIEPVQESFMTVIPVLLHKSN